MASFAKAFLASKGVFVGFTLAALLATLIVAIGLYLEYEQYEDRKKRIGNVLVVAGVVLEALFGLVAFISADIRESRSERQIAELTFGAAQLEKDTTVLRLQIATAERDAAAATAQAKEAESHLADANRAASEANARAAKAALELAKFKAPRTLTDAQIKVIADKLIVFVGQAFQITTYWVSHEPLGLANRIFLALQLSRWTYIKPTGWSSPLFNEEGVFVYVHPHASESSKNAANALVSALNNAGIVSELKHADPSAKEIERISISVTAKPSCG